VKKKKQGATRKRNELGEKEKKRKDTVIRKREEQYGGWKQLPGCKKKNKSTSGHGGATPRPRRVRDTGEDHLETVKGFRRNRTKLVPITGPGAWPAPAQGSAEGAEGDPKKTTDITASGNRQLNHTTQKKANEEAMANAALDGTQGGGRLSAARISGFLQAKAQDLAPSQTNAPPKKPHPDSARWCL